MSDINELVTDILNYEEEVRKMSRETRLLKGKLAKAVFDTLGPEDAIESGAFTINIRQINRIFR